MDGLIAKQYANCEAFDKFVINLKKCSKANMTAGYYRGRLEGLRELWTQFREIHSKILLKAEVKDKEIPYFIEDSYSKYEAIFYEYYGKIQDGLLDLESQANTSFTPEGPTKPEVKLPAIKIPSFSGNYSEWRSFHDMFSALIRDHPSLTNVQKLHYLKTSVTGEAEQLLRSYSITETNFSPAWEALNQRYENKQLLINAQLNLLFNTKPVSESATSIRALYDTTNECISALKSLAVRVEFWDLAIIHNQVYRLSTQTRQAWEQLVSKTTDPPTLRQYLEFLNSRFRMLEATTPQTFSADKQVKRQNQSSVGIQTNCVFCQQNHPLRKCSTFQPLAPEQKLKFVKAKFLCVNCLAIDHTYAKCPSKHGCFKCGRRHHTVLHDAYSNVSNTEPSQRVALITNHNNDSVLLATALISVPVNGEEHLLRALVDTGSQASFITVSASQRLRLRASPTMANISGIGKLTTGNARKMVSFQLRSRHQLEFRINVKAIILPSLTDRLPQTETTHHCYEHLTDIQLADPFYYQPGNIDVILGSDIYPLLIREGIKTGPPNTPMAQNTALGWILLGPIKSEPQQPNPVYSFFNKVELDQQLRKFWEVEEAQVVNVVSEDERKCEEHFQQTHHRSTDGRYIVSLPFKATPELLGSSYSQATRQFFALEHRLLRDPALYTSYKQCIAEYLQLGQMVRIPDNEITSQPHYYVPHHAVLKPSSSTTKVRVVFNASCKTSNGTSLNDILYIGPSLHQDLVSVIIRWRTYRIVFSADMEKMYRNIWMAPEHCDFQRLLFRFHPDEPVMHFRILTILFGVSPSPYLALRTIRQLVKDEGRDFDLGSRVLSEETFVDNVLSGADNMEEAIRTQDELIKLLERGRLKLRQWAANTPALVSRIPESDRSVSPELEIQNGSQSISALGLAWDPAADQMFMKANLQAKENSVTKRSVLSLTARLFDPLGWYAPIIVVAKIMMQRLWLLGVGWDEPLPEKEIEAWESFKNSLCDIGKIRVPRWIQTTNQSLIQIHGFCDASERAYAAAVYVRVQTGSTVTTSLVMAKTRVSPVKTLSLPRLELCGATLLSALVQRVSKDMKIRDADIYAWTDSTIVLSWLTDHPCRWKTFVANRTSHIRERLPTALWRHTPSKENSADLASRGTSSNTLSSSTLWWSGPSWLAKPPDNWPSQPKFGTTLESRKVVTLAAHFQAPELLISIIEYSSYTKLIRVTAFCLRFISNCRLSVEARQKQHLNPIEIAKATEYWIRYVQGCNYTKDIQSLQSDGQTSPNSKIRNLTPFIDNNKVLRVGGRLRHTDLPYNEKHPVLLPYNDPFTKLIVSYYHTYTLHGNVSLMMSTIRRLYWIPKLRNMVKCHIFRCIKCFRLRMETSMQLMGDLPHHRVTPSRPFSITGLDYAGPLSIRMSKGRNLRTYKGYIAIFVCFSSKAIHLEAVSDLTTEALMAALRRFIARRGLCSHIYSDCGTNFVGAKAKLDNDYKQCLRNCPKEAAESLATLRVNWHFIPPSAPHFGGLWEAGVRSMKYHLRRIVGNAVLTYEELATVLTQIEASLNSRPLCPLSDDPNEIASLTPGHFLIGSALNSPPEEYLCNVEEAGLKRWTLVQKLQQDFWERWRTEYLHRLQQRPKWCQRMTNIKTGDLVIIKDERLPPLKWTLGRVSETYSGPDGLIRVVDVKTANSDGRYRNYVYFHLMIEMTTKKLSPLISISYPYQLFYS